MIAMESKKRKINRDERIEYTCVYLGYGVMNVLLQLVKTYIFILFYFFLYILNSTSNYKSLSEPFTWYITQVRFHMSSHKSLGKDESKDLTNPGVFEFTDFLKICYLGSGMVSFHLTLVFFLFLLLEFCCLVGWVCLSTVVEGLFLFFL